MVCAMWCVHNVCVCGVGVFANGAALEIYFSAQEKIARITPRPFCARLDAVIYCKDIELASMLSH